MNLLILTILIYGNGHFISIKFIQMERRNTCLLHNSIWNLIEIIIPALLKLFLAEKSKRVFLGTLQSQWKNERQIISFRVLSTFTYWTKIFHCLSLSGTWNSPPHPPLNPPLQKLNFLFPIFLLTYCWSQKKKKKIFSPLPSHLDPSFITLALYAII